MPDTPYVGRRVARPAEPEQPEQPEQHVEPALAVAPEVAPEVAAPTVPAEPVTQASTAGPSCAPGKRRAVKHAGSRGSLFRVLPPTPVLVGAAALAVSVGGALSSSALVEGPDLASSQAPKYHAASALGGQGGQGTVSSVGRRAQLSRDSDRQALAEAADSDLVAAAESQAKKRNVALEKFAQQAEQQAAKIAKNQWQLPVAGYHLTARFGDYGLWSSYHTGLDFAAPTGTPIHAVANGTVTSAAYDGAYGNKTVITLDDGTELWFCHQTTQYVSEGDTVRAGDLIGTIGSTGHVTGPHLHLEVRPGGGDPVDPYAALVVHGVTP